MEATGERYLLTMDSSVISYEHWHRYLYATQFVKDKIVLDIASGEGYGAFTLAKNAKKVIGVDISQEAVSWASSKYFYENLEFRLGSAAAIPVDGNNFFDVVTSFETIEHISEEDQKEFLNEVKRLLKPDGLFIVSTPNKLTYSDIPNYQNEYHVKEFYLQEFKEFLEKSFEHVTILGQKNYPVSYIWNPNSDRGGLIEYRLQHTRDGFEPTDARKQILYAIAVCSNSPIEDQHVSVMVDISERMISELEEKIRQQAEIINQLQPKYNAQLFFDTGLNFNSTQVITLPVHGQEGILEFDLTAYNGIKSMRFDPLDDLVSIHLNEVQLVLENNDTISINEFKTSKCYRVGQDFIFETPDPQMIFDVPAEHYRKIIFSVNYVALGKDGYSFLLKNKNNELSELTFALKIKEEELVSISTVLKDKEAELVSISTVLKDKEAELVKQKVATQKQFADHAAQIQQLKQQLNEAKNLLNRILLSTSWKVTGPMRWARRILSTLSWKLAISLRQLRRNMRIIPARFDLGRLSSGSGQKDICINVAHITSDNVQMDLIRNSGLFDDKYYNQSYPDIEKAGIDALQHYYYYGWKEGRNPSVDFNTQYYLDSNDAVRKANINPLLHYIKFGKAQVLSEQCRHIQEIEIQDTFEPPYPIDIPRNDSPVKTIAFYLPQYHPIPENDEWWGKNFTDWTNVSKAKPNFEGHYQPHLPYDLGFYDLRIPSVIEQQISMAKSFGIYGFCFYYYWFAGKILLEKPLKIFLENKDLDINFCLCWANENWTRRWDGQESDILIAQKHSDEDDLAFIENISKYLNDHRYIRINGKPLLLVYRPKLFPDMKKTVKIWRNFCRAKDIGEIYVGMCQTFGEYNPLIYDLDFAVEFPPHNIPAAEITSTITTIDKYSGHIYDGNILVKKISHSLNQKPSYNWFRCVMMNWDNTARKGLKGHTYLGITPAKFGEWFWKACQFSIKYQPCNERFVFINAWNEWAEGTHLEPCRKMGYSYLNQIGKVIKKISYKNGKETLVSIVVPTFNAEKFIAETLLSIVHQTHPCIEIVIVDDGSSDDTRAIVNDFVEENQDFKIVTHFQANQGAHAAINKGIEIATGEILAICNHDDFFAKNRIEIMVNEMLRNDSEMAFSRVKVNILNGQNKDGKNLKKTIDNKVSSIMEFPNIGYALLDFNVAISSGNLIFSKNIWKKIGGFQNLKYCHDWMFALQALNHTTPVFVNMELYEYQIHENNTFRDLTHLAEKETQLVLESFFNERLWTEKTKNFFSDKYYFDNFINNRNYRKYFSSDLSKQASKYKHFRKGYCPICQTESVFFCNEDWLRDFYRCEKCNSLPRNRAIFNVLNTHCSGWKDLKMHESSPSNNYFSNHSKNYSFSQFFENKKLGLVLEGVRNESLENLTFSDNSFDLIVSLDVLEHIFNPEKAIKEMLRVVRPGGNVVFTVPIHKNLKQTIQQATLSQTGEIEYLSPPQYHGNPIGDGKSLVTWDYGIDFSDILKEWIDDQHIEIKIINKSNEEMGIIGEYLDVILIRKPKLSNSII